MYDPYDSDSKKQREKHTRFRYGIDTYRYDEMLADQRYACAICQRPESRTDADGNPKRLVVDHDHSRCCPGRSSCRQCLRGLLCTTCNVTLGHYDDDPALFQRFIEYLTTYERRRAIE